MCPWSLGGAVSSGTPFLPLLCVHRVCVPPPPPPRQGTPISALSPNACILKHSLLIILNVQLCVCVSLEMDQHVVTGIPLPHGSWNGLQTQCSPVKIDGPHKVLLTTSTETSVRSEAMFTCDHYTSFFEYLNCKVKNKKGTDCLK